MGLKFSCSFTVICKTFNIICKKWKKILKNPQKPKEIKEKWKWKKNLLIIVDMEWFVPSEDTDESSQRKDNRVIDADFHIISEGPTEGIKDRHHKKYQKK